MRSIHQTRFVCYGNFVIALLKLIDRDSMFDARHLLEPHTEESLSWMDCSSKNALKAKTFVADDFLQTFPGADLVLICKNKGAKFFAKMVVLDSKLETAKTFDVKVKVTPNKTSYLRMMDAVDRIWNPRDGRPDLWNMLLNHYPKQLKSTNAFADAESAKRRIRSCFEECFAECFAAEQYKLERVTIACCTWRKSLRSCL